VAAVRDRETIFLLGEQETDFAAGDLVLHRRQSLPYHPNGMRFSAYGQDGELLRSRTSYSVGGGFVVDEPSDGTPPAMGGGADDAGLPYPFASAAELLRRCTESGLPISGVMLANEVSRRPADQVRARLLDIWAVMRQCTESGCGSPGTLPGGLKVPRRAPELHRQLLADPDLADPLHVMDWVNLFAIAVNEENAAGGRVVTAPTNGAAGVIPAVLHYYARFCPGASDDGVVRFLLTAGAIGALYKQNASISGAEVGCQGEVGSACSMAAGALCEVLGGTPRQAENAAEIGMEHNLGLTCDPVGGLVQVPCIERNAMAAVKAINAARIALMGSGEHLVSLDTVIKTMRETGADMKTKYKETARGGLAVNVIEC
jgi:L-serine dehydratase